MTLIYLAVGLVIVILLARFVFNSQNQGVHYRQGQATMEDVVKLAQSGNKLMAIKAYRDIHRVGLKEAKEAVERL